MCTFEVETRVEIYFHYIPTLQIKPTGSGNEEEIKRKYISTIFPLPITRRFSSRYCVWDWQGTNPRISIKASLPNTINAVINTPPRTPENWIEGA
jgi:hypothetical protein